MATIQEVKEYWETNTPQYWYSKKEPGTREYYDEIQAHRYNVVYHYLPEAAQFDKQKGKKVLEIGCGQGTDLLQFAKSGAEVYGIDLTEAAIQKSKRMFETYGLTANLQTMNSEDMSAFPDETFDLVYSFGVIHHTPRTEQVVGEIRRILKPGGKLHLMIYSKGLNYLVRYIFFHVGKGKFLRQDFQTTINQYTEYKWNCPLTKMYSKREARTLLSGFRNIEILKQYNHHLVYRAPKSVQLPFGKVLGDNLFIRCEK